MTIKKISKIQPDKFEFNKNNIDIANDIIELALKHNIDGLILTNAKSQAIESYDEL